MEGMVKFSFAESAEKENKGMITANIKLNYSEMFQAEKKVADYVLANTTAILKMSISDLAKASDTSDATIIRMCRRVGCSGFQQFKIALASEHGDALEKAKDITNPTDVVEYFEKISKLLTDVVKNIDMETLKRTVDALSKAEVVFTTAWGNTNEIAADMAHRLTRVGIKSFNCDIPEYFIRSLGLGNERDVLVAISHSGQTIHVIDALTLAGKLGMKTILITNTPHSSCEEHADYVLCINAGDELFEDFGAVSHMLEYMVVDSILYFLKGNKNMIEKSDRTEILLSQYKL